MSIINEIKEARNSLLTAEQKEQLLAYIKKNLTSRDFVVIGGAKHYHHDWLIPSPDNKDWWRTCEAPFRYHAAITDWLICLGFNCSRYYNGFGVDIGIRVSI